MQENATLDLKALAAAVEEAARTNEILRDRMAEGGRCFHLALYAAMDLADRLGCACQIIHAILGNGLVHAWTEVDGKFCVDLTLADEHPELMTSTKERYLAIARLSDSRTYGVLEALALTQQNVDTPGLWHSPFTDQLAVNHKSSERSDQATKPESDAD